MLAPRAHSGHIGRVGILGRAAASEKHLTVAVLGPSGYGKIEFNDV